MRAETGRQTLVLNEWLSIDNETYHKSEGIGASMLKVLAQQSAMHLRDKTANPPEISPATQATLDFGTMVHAAVLEPDLYRKTYVAEPVFERKSGTTIVAQKEEWAKEQGNKRIASKKDMDKAEAMSNAIYRHSYAKALLVGGKKEQSAYWQDKDTGLICKFRPDCISASNQFIVDVKTTADVSNKAFKSQTANLMYHLQAAHYLEGAQATGLAPTANFVFIAVEKTPPYAVVVYELSEYFLSLGQDWRHYCMRQYDACKKANDWPGPDPAQTLDPPNWVHCAPPRFLHP